VLLNRRSANADPIGPTTPGLVRTSPPTWSASRSTWRLAGPRPLIHGPRRRCAGLAWTGLPWTKPVRWPGVARPGPLVQPVVDHAGPLVQHNVDHAAQLVRAAGPTRGTNAGPARRATATPGPDTRRRRNPQVKPALTLLGLWAYVTCPTSRDQSRSRSGPKPVRDHGPERATPSGTAPGSRTNGALVQRMVRAHDGPGGWTKYGWSRSLVQPAHDQRSGGLVQEHVDQTGNAVVQSGRRPWPGTGPRPAARMSARPWGQPHGRRQTVVGHYRAQPSRAALALSAGAGGSRPDGSFLQEDFVQVAEGRAPRRPLDGGRRRASVALDALTYAPPFAPPCRGARVSAIACHRSPAHRPDAVPPIRGVMIMKATAAQTPEPIHATDGLRGGRLVQVRRPRSSDRHGQGTTTGADRG
jgi:hypothetical protein